MPQKTNIESAAGRGRVRSVGRMFFFFKKRKRKREREREESIVTLVCGSSLLGCLDACVSSFRGATSSPGTDPGSKNPPLSLSLSGFFLSFHRHSYMHS